MTILILQNLHNLLTILEKNVTIYIYIYIYRHIIIETHNSKLYYLL